MSNVNPLVDHLAAVQVAEPRRRPLRVALLGFGTVGASVARILVERPELASRLQLTYVFNRDVARKRAGWVPSTVQWTEDVDDLLGPMPDVVVEVIGGIDPVGGWVRRALEQGASVVTANKVLLAAHAPELLHLAATRGKQLRFEAAVGGGVPLIHGVREGLAGDNLRRVAGILNGTSNYVLSRMARSHEDMGPVLEDARKLGYAEADPSADIDGDDAGAKLVVLGGIAFRRHLRLTDIPRSSIRPLQRGRFPVRQASRLHDSPDCDGRCPGRGLPCLRRAGPRALRLQFWPERRGQQRGHDLRPVRWGEQLQRCGRGRPGHRCGRGVRPPGARRAAAYGEHAEEWLPGTVVPPRRDRITCDSSCTTGPASWHRLRRRWLARTSTSTPSSRNPAIRRMRCPSSLRSRRARKPSLLAALEDIAGPIFTPQPPLALPMLLGEDSRNRDIFSISCHLRPAARPPGR